MPAYSFLRWLTRAMMVGSGQRLLPLIAVMLVCLVQTNHVLAQKIHLLIVADTDDPAVGKDVEKDWKNIRQQFLENVPESQLNLREITGRDVTRENILASIRRLSVGRNDTIVFAYAGHGLYDETVEKGKERGHALQLTHGPKGNPVQIAVPGTSIAVTIDEMRLVYRTELIKTLENQRARLVVVWTDCCNTVVKVTEKERTKVRGTISAPVKISPLFDSLFMKPSGLIDLITSQKGEMAYGDEVGREGGIATVSLCRFLKTKRDEAISWDQMFALLSSSIAEDFRKSFPTGAVRSQFGLQPQTTQTLHRAAWKLEGASAVAKVSPKKGPFGVTVVDDDAKRGVRITKVVSGSAAELRVAARIDGKDVVGGLTVGDIITHINDKAIRTEKEFADAFDQSGATMRLQFLNSRERFESVRATVDLSVR